MTGSSSNPFVLPGLGQTGDMANNPLFASMEMMRKAFAGLAGPAGMGALRKTKKYELNLSGKVRGGVAFPVHASQCPAATYFCSGNITAFKLYRRTLPTRRQAGDEGRQPEAKQGSSSECRAGAGRQAHQLAAHHDQPVVNQERGK